MKRLLSAAIVIGMFGILGAPAQALAAFGLETASFKVENQDGSEAIQAGAHPFAVTTQFSVNSFEDPELGLVPEGAVKDIAIHFPPGVVGNPDAIAPCSNDDFTSLKEGGNICPEATIIGAVELVVGFAEHEFYRVPLYNLEPAPGHAAKVGFVVLGVPVTIDVGVNPLPPHDLIAEGSDVSQAIRFYGVKVSVWGNPASPIHDSERGHCYATPQTDSCPVDIPEKPFLTSPRSCSGPLQSRFEIDSWQDPAARLAYPVQSEAGMAGCSGLEFAPKVSSQLTSGQASSPSGLRFDLDIQDDGLTAPGGTAGSDIKKAEVLLPEGVTLNPAAASGLAACSEADLARESAFSDPGAGCPQSSKLGEVEVETPLLEGKILHGQIFAATPYQNPFGSLIALYMVIKDPELGIFVSQPGKVELDPATGQVKTTFGEPGFEVPQFPFSHLRFRFREGQRAPLVAPATCGSYETKAVFTPWANPEAPYTTTASFEVSSGCTQGTAPFDPGFSAGSVSNAAGAYSPFDIRITRGSGEQELTRFSAVLPKGVTGKLAGLVRCSDEAIASAAQRSGALELAMPSCPAASKIGETTAGAGAGSELTWVGGSLYLAGPFAGDPLSVVAITPAVAGPFDLGTVVVREGLDLDPETGEVRVDGGAANPIPHILQGVPLRLRDLRIDNNRPDFTLNPTSCEEKHSRATLVGSGEDASNPGDDRPVSLSARYQASSCASLAFKPKLSLQLKGGTKRNRFPALTAKLTFPPGGSQANTAGATVILPHSAFLESSHIGTTCTRVQFAADQCPPASVYGKAVARTPLLDEPLEGPVYLRSNGGERQLPDLVVALHGVVDIDLVGYVDSVKARLRTRFQNVPDAPVSSFVLKMDGGRKGLIVNSQNLCDHRGRAQQRLVAQNGMEAKGRPPVQALGCGKKGNRKPGKR